MLCRQSSIRSRAGHNTSKSYEVQQLNLKYEGEISGLRDQISALEMKNKKYLEIIGMTAGEHQENMKLQMEAAQDQLQFSKRAKQEGLTDQFLDECDAMLEAQQQELNVLRN